MRHYPDITMTIPWGCQFTPIIAVEANRNGVSCAVFSKQGES